MFNLGLFELTLFGVIALIVLGPDKLPHAARTLGKWYGFVMHAKSRLQTDILNELQLLETQEELKKELAKLKATESELKTQMHALQQSVENSRRDIFNNQVSAFAIPDDTPSTPDLTKPMTGQFFLLSEYDRQRRLPKAPFLPNYTADTLLNFNT